ncbi:hypothetical protein MHM95_09380 [Pseudoalteromonas sp. CnMc7-15]|uniref:hypothetical protein n=1 Tax=unclassified Pseudoalteromonas TaxID=194690 RepID=UPI001EF541DE|nr:hypothetical protein [Pseudoalteromonas sp. CnMc7-15]MCG7566501.1 hypothetical protein [Pseudoalteromonas sp. CnMc7-15]
MPFALSYFSNDVFSVWMIFVTFYGLIVVFDFGLSATFARQLNYILSGAQRLEVKGTSQHVDEKNINSQLFTGVIDASKYTFFLLGCLCSIFFVLFYFAYLTGIEEKLGASLWLEWSIYCLAIVISLFSLQYNAIFFGTYNVTSIYRVCTISNLIFFSVAILLIYQGGGLLSIAVARLVAAIVYLLHSIVEVKNYNMLRFYQTNLKGRIKSARETLFTLLPNVSRLGLVSLGNYLSAKATVFLTASFLPLALSASYSFVLNIFTTISSVSLLYMTIHTPKLNSLMQRRDMTRIRVLQSKVRLVSLGCMVAAGSLFFAIGDYLLALLESDTQLLMLAPMLALFLVYLLDTNKQLAQNLLMTGNHVDFALASITAGVGVVFVTWAALAVGFESVYTPIVAILLVQGVFNFWYWPLQERKLTKST